jgi:hypothetical protein
MVRWIGSILKGEGFSRQAKRAFDIQPKVQYCDQGYDFKAPELCEAQGRRPLIIATLKPRNSFRPSFPLRWDPHGNHLNVDIEGVSSKVKKLFNNEKQGYHGHRPRLVADRLFEVDIGIPSLDVFRGEISFKLHENVILNDGLDRSVVISEEVVKVLKTDDPGHAGYQAR